MRNIEIRITKTGPDDAGLNQMLTDARMEERRGRVGCDGSTSGLFGCPYRVTSA